MGTEKGKNKMENLLFKIDEQEVDLADLTDWQVVYLHSRPGDLVYKSYVTLTDQDGEAYEHKVYFIGELYDDDRDSDDGAQDWTDRNRYLVL